jgi:mannose-1-phosphate guanylyltransferase
MTHINENKSHLIMHVNSITDVTSVIIFGGTGTRLWPLLHSGFTKRFKVSSGTTNLFRLANGLATKDISVGDMSIVMGKLHRCLERIILHGLKEPIGVNDDML